MTTSAPVVANYLSTTKKYLHSLSSTTNS